MGFLTKREKPRLLALMRLRSYIPDKAMAGIFRLSSGRFLIILINSRPLLFGMDKSLTRTSGYHESNTFTASETEVAVFTSAP